MQGASTSKDGKLMYKYECIYSNEELIKNDWKSKPKPPRQSGW
jgi:hypothetical protein